MMLERLRVLYFCLLFFLGGAVLALTRLPVALWRIVREVFVAIIFGRLEPLREAKRIRKARGER